MLQVSGSWTKQASGWTKEHARRQSQHTLACWPWTPKNWASKEASSPGLNLPQRLGTSGCMKCFHLRSSSETMSWPAAILEKNSEGELASGNLRSGEVSWCLRLVVGGLCAARDMLWAGAWCTSADKHTAAMQLQRGQARQEGQLACLPHRRSQRRTYVGRCWGHKGRCTGHPCLRGWFCGALLQGLLESAQAAQACKAHSRLAVKPSQVKALRYVKGHGQAGRPCSKAGLKS